MKLRCMASSVALTAMLLSFWLGGCGGSSKANVVTVTVNSSAGAVLILGQSTTLTATVSGATNTNVNWQPCQFTTTTVSGTTPTTSTAATCPTDGTLGTLSNQEATGTATFTAASKVPDQTKYPNLQVILTAQSQQDTKITGNIKLALDSGIGAALTPTTATVPTNEQQTFTSVLTNDLQSQGVVWTVTQSSPIAATSTTAAVNYPALPTCSPTCGTITSSGLYGAIYTAPASVPTVVTPSSSTSTTPQNVTVVGTAKADNTRFVIGTVTIIAGGPISFNGVSPSIAPQGAALWDIYLDAPNISSASIITLADQNGGKKSYTSVSGQVKVLFPIPTSTTTNPPSTGARVRLFEGDLPPTVSTYTVSVTDPGEPVTQTAGGNFTINVVPVRPTVVSTLPQGIVQGADQNQFPVTIDGGYFGPGGTLATALFQGNQIPQGTASNSRRLSTFFPASAVGPPGLYPLLVSRTASPLPVPNNPAVSTIAVFPDYSTAPPTVGSAVTTGANPSAIDIDPQLGVVVVALTGANAVQFYSIAPGALTPIGGPVAVGQVPTGLSVNRTNHSVAVVNYGSQSISILPLPGAPTPVTAATVDISGALQGQAAPVPLPYAIGVDPDTNLALVAYSSSSIASAANVGFVVNLNQGAGAPYGCLGGTGTPPCLYSQVTLNTGQYPQVAMAPHGHLAYVTPGGFGVMRGVDVTLPSTSLGISSISLTSGIVTVTTSGTLTGIVPGIPATVLITGVPTTNAAGNTNFNGVFSINSTSSNTFNYALNTTASGTASGGTVFYGGPNVNFGGISQTTQGIAINPITHSAALVDSDATGLNAPQIHVLNQLDQSVTSITLFATCTAFSPTCANGPEFIGTASVAWQPYTNSIISYNPGRPGSGSTNQVSVSDPVTAKRYAIVDFGQTTSGSVSLPVQNGTTGTLILSGGVAVDPATNQAFVTQSGSNLIQVINLGPSTTNTLKKTEITEIVVPSPQPGPGIIGGIPKALLPQGTLTSTSDLAGVQIFGAGFTSGAQVRLDGTPLPGGNVNIDPGGRLITATIPASFLAKPHHYALDVISGGVQSNATDFIVITAVDMSVACTTGPATPSSIAIADQLANGPFSPIAVVTNSGCNNISTIDINTASATFGHVLHSIAVGATPQGIAVSPRLGLAVIANNGDATASVVNLLTNTQPVAAVAVGTNPIGVAVSDATGVALVANFTSNTVSEINLGLLFGSAPATSLTASTIGGIQQPIAVAIDPDRGTNNQGLAVVTGLQLNNGSTSSGALYPVDIGLAAPTLSTTISISTVSSSPTGIVFNPAVSTGTANRGLFYANASGANTIGSFNPDTGGVSNTNVGINPTALAVNPQSGAILTSNFAGKSASVVDTVTSGARTVQTLGLPGSAQFGVAIDQFTNLAAVVDQANNRVLLFPMPN
jgi:DNA-binding beta-propeller fold protein YncE